MIFLPIPISPTMMPCLTASIILTAAAIPWAWGFKGWRVMPSNAGSG